MTMLTATAPWLDQIADWETYLRAANRPATTRELRTYQLRRFAHDHPHLHPYDVTFDHLINWLAAHPWKASTRRSYRAALRVFYAWAHAGGRAPTNPAWRLPPITVPRSTPRPAPDDAVRQALAVAGVRERLMIVVLAQTGIRRGELARLHTHDVLRDAAGWCLHVHGKGGRERLVPLTDSLARCLRSVEPGWVFPGQIDGHLSPRRVGELVAQTLPDHWTAHTLRHRYATNAYALERDIRATQELLGHAKIETTMVYTQVPDAARRRAAMAAAAAGGLAA